MSSKRAIRRRACAGKRRYATDQAAKDALAGHRENFGRMTPYRCQFCGGFHLGHPPRKVRQAIDARRAANVTHA